MLAHAFLSVLAASQQPPQASTAPATNRPPLRLIPLTRNEIRRLFTGLLTHLHPAAFQLHWSHWRRHHQAVARACHYRRRALTLP